MKELAFLVVCIFIVNAGAVNETIAEKTSCNNMNDELKQLVSIANFSGVALPYLHTASTCRKGIDEKTKQKMSIITFQFEGETCEIWFNDQTLDLAMLNDHSTLDRFKKQAQNCYNKIKHLEANKIHIDSCAQSQTQLAGEKSIDDWKLLMRAFRKFVLKGLIQSRVLYKQNIIKYTHTKDDGDHLQVILALDKIRCEFQIYRHPSSEGRRVRVYHDDGPSKKRRSYFIKSRDDRKFTLPNCAIVLATNLSKKLMNKFMRE